MLYKIIADIFNQFLCARHLSTLHVLTHLFLTINLSSLELHWQSSG